jgi:uncharacterized protein
MRTTLTLVVSLFAGTMLFSADQAAKSKVLLLVGGEIHDWKGIGDSVGKTLGASNLFEITRVDQDLNALAEANLSKYNVVVFYWTLGDLTNEQRSGLLNAVASGKTNFVTFHSGADSFRGDPAYRAFVGGYFLTHPAYRDYEVSVTEVAHPITKGIERFMHTDEQYILDYDPRETVLASSLYKGKLMPTCWVKEWGKGRIFYTGMGHDARACEDPMFKKIITRAVAWAAGAAVPE